MVYGVISRLAGPAIKYVARSIYTTLRAQDRIVDYTYRRTGLYNRGVVRGIKHGLAGGQIIGGGLSLGLNAEDSPGNDGQIFQKRPKPSPRKPYQTRQGRTRRYSSGKYSKCYPRRRDRYSNTGRN